MEILIKAAQLITSLAILVTLHEFGQVDFLGKFGVWPVMEIEVKIYGFSLLWPDEEGTHLIRFGVLNN